MNSRLVSLPRRPPPLWEISHIIYPFLWFILFLHLLVIHAYTWVHVPSVILVYWGQGRPRQYILAVWIPFVCPRAFLPPRCGLWAWYEMGRGPQILWPHNNLSKSYCLVPRTGRRVLIFSGLCHGWLSLIPLWAPGTLRLPKVCSWHFGVRGALSLMLLWDDADRFGTRSVYSMAPLWSGVDLAVKGSFGNWAKFISLDISSLSFVRSEFPQISPSI